LVAIGIAATSSPAFAELRTYLLSWTSPGSGWARGTLTLDDAVCDNPGANTLMAPEGCFVALAFTVSGDIKGKGTYTLDDMQDVNLSAGVALDLNAELVAQAPSDINFFSNGGGPGGIAPLVMAASGASASDQLTLVSAAPLEFPFPVAAAKCSAAVGKAGAAYYAARHKALHACRISFTKGVDLFTDKAKTNRVLLASGCAGEFKAATRIAKARNKLRAGLAKKCSDAVLATIPACAASVDLLVDSGAATGCLLETVDFNVDELIHAEFGF
jgi:hypothetical protein